MRKEQFQFLDQHEKDKIDEDLDWGGDDGLSSTGSLFYKYPSSTFLSEFHIMLEDDMNAKEAHDVSPGRLSFCNRATANVQKKADLVMAKALKKLPNLAFKLVDVVLITLDDVDHTKVDGASLAGFIVLKQDKIDSLGCSEAGSSSPCLHVL